MAGTLTSRRTLRTRRVINQLAKPSHHDQVTGLPDQSAFRGYLRTLIDGFAPPKYVGLCIIALDNLHTIRMTCGPDIADHLLRAAAGRLHNYATLAGRYAARYSADEILVLTGGSGEQDIDTVTAEAIAIISAPFDIDGCSIRLVAHAGAAEYPTRDITAAELIHTAITALRWTANGTSSQALSREPERPFARTASRQLSRDIVPAIGRGEFILQYQPLCDLTSHRLLGVEALVRWNHPAYGLLAPDEFIPLAEDNGSILVLGNALLRQACRDATAWNTQPHVYVSVNIATAQLCDPDLHRIVADILTDTGLPATRLHLEVTESAAAYTDRHARQNLKRLTDLGIRIAIDDFGTGYANFAALTDLPFTELKIPLPFVQGITADGATVNTDPILTFITELAHTYHLTVTAEGIETSTHAERMRDLGFHTGQGWYFGKPQAPTAISQLLAA